MRDALIETVVERLVLAWRSGQRQPATGLSLPDAAAAYAVQQRVGERLGWFDDIHPRVWKLGGAPGGLVSSAFIPENAIHPSGWQVPAHYVTEPGIEGELTIRLGADLSGAPDLAEILSAIDAWLPAIELCDTRWVDGATADPLLKLADQQLSRALILGDPILPADVPMWAQQPATLRIDQRDVLACIGSHPFVDPLASLPWLARHAAVQKTPLRAGDLITTGSWTGIHWADKGQHIEVDFNDFGTVTLRT